MINDRKAYWAWELPEDIAKAIEESEMDPKHDELNELMNDDQLLNTLSK
jgi:hypothetical protein